MTDGRAPDIDRTFLRSLERYAHPELKAVSIASRRGLQKSAANMGNFSWGEAFEKNFPDRQGNGINVFPAMAEFPKTGIIFRPARNNILVIDLLARMFVSLCSGLSPVPACVVEASG
jgi:hypothetical protein